MKPGRDDGQRMEEGDQENGHDRRPQSSADVAGGEPQPEQGGHRERQMADPVNPHPRLGIGRVEQPEVAEPTQAKLPVPTRAVVQLIDRPPEQDPRSLGLGNGTKQLEVLTGQGDVIDVTRLVPGGPEHAIERCQPGLTFPLVEHLLHAGAHHFVGPFAECAIPLPERIAEGALDRHELTVNQGVADDPGRDPRRCRQHDQGSKPGCLGAGTPLSGPALHNGPESARPSQREDRVAQCHRRKQGPSG